MRQRHLRELLLVELGDHAAPQLRRRQHVRLVHRDDTAGPSPRQAERPAGDPLDLLAGVAADVHRVVVPELLAAEVQAAGQLAHDHQVDVAVAHRPQVRVRVELAAELQQPLLGTPRGRLPARAADGAQQHRVGRLDGGAHVRRERVAVLVDRVAAERQVHLAHTEAEQLARRVDHAPGLGHHLGADAVARKAGDYGDRAGVGHRGSNLIRLRRAPAPVRLRSWRARTPAGRPPRTPR